MHLLVQFLPDREGLNMKHIKKCCKHLQNTLTGIVPPGLANEVTIKLVICVDRALCGVYTEIYRVWDYDSIVDEVLSAVLRPSVTLLQFQDYRAHGCVTDTKITRVT